MSTIRKVPPGRSAAWIAERARRVGEVVDDVERGHEVVGAGLERPRVALLEATLVSRSAAASALAAAMPSSEMSMPVTRLAGKASAIRLAAWPCPQPTSRRRGPRAAARPARRRAAA